MRAGILVHKVAILEPVVTQNAYGETGNSWRTKASVWAGIEPISAKEYFTAEQTTSLVTHRIRMRYRTGITPVMRIQFGERVFNILSVINEREEGTDLLLMCTERNPSD